MSASPNENARSEEWGRHTGAILRSRWVGFCVHTVGWLFAVVVLLIVFRWPHFFAHLLSKPGARTLLWVVGVLELLAVVARAWAIAHEENRKEKAQAEGTGTACGPCANDRAGAPGPARGESRSWLERQFEWVFAYPLFPLQIAVLCAISWLGLGDGLGFPDLIWTDESDAAKGAEETDLLTRVYLFANGFAVAVLFANAVTVRYLLDRRPGLSGTPTGPLANGGVSLFEYMDVDPEVRRLGTFLLRLWLPLLAVFVLPKVFSPDIKPLFVWLFNGIGAAVVVTIATTYLTEVRFRSPDHGPKRGMAWLVQQLPGFASGRISDDQLRLHTRVGWMMTLPALLLLVVCLTSLVGLVWPPVVVVCLILALLNSVYGLVAFHFAGLQYVVLALCALLGIVCNTQYPQKMSFPHLEGQPVVDLDQVTVNWDTMPDEHKSKWEETQKKLVKSDTMLTNFHQKWEHRYDPKGAPKPERKPKLVLVATSGGGIRAAVWTAAVLEQLEKRMPGADGGSPFRDHIRVICGASGGMQAAGLYAADFENTEKPEPLSTQLAKDSLWPTVQTMLIHDLPFVAVPWGGLLGAPHDRGRSLEDAWVRNTMPPKGKGSKSPFEKTFAELNKDGAEEQCNRPSLVFSPMMVEDCRRLLITNLNLGKATTTNCNTLNKPLPPRAKPDEPLGLDDTALSIPVLDFWRAFPGAHDTFQVKTAARMSATFPFVGPGVNLPVFPERRVVDAGYFDNFGINLASVWVARHKQWIEDHTSGVVIIEIRAYPRRHEKMLYDPDYVPAEPRKKGSPKPHRNELSTSALSELSTPLEAIVNLYSRGAYFRNDLLLDALNRELNVPKNAQPDKQPFFTTVMFECNQNVALSWTLPQSDFDAIMAVFEKDKTLPWIPDDEAKALKVSQDEWDEAANRLRDWFGKGGTELPTPKK